MSRSRETPARQSSSPWGDFRSRRQKSGCLRSPVTLTTSSKVSRFPAAPGAGRRAGGIESQAKAAVLAIGQQDDRLCVPFGRETNRAPRDRWLRRCWSRPYRARSFRSIDASDGSANEFANIGKRKLQVRVCGKVDHRGLIERRERVDQGIGGTFHFIGVPQDARARVDHHGNAGGLARGVKVRDRLRDAIVEDAEVGAFEPGHGFAFQGGNAAGDRNHLRDDLDGRWRDQLPAARGLVPGNGGTRRSARRWRGRAAS